MIAVCLTVSVGVCSAGEQSASGKTLILYYSKTGNTRAACEALQKETGADIQEIKDLNSRKGFWAGTGMLKIFMGMQTDIEPETVDFGPYDTLSSARRSGLHSSVLPCAPLSSATILRARTVIIFITADSFVDEKYQQQAQGACRGIRRYGCRPFSGAGS